jgi:hypothetical protein
VWLLENRTLRWPILVDLSRCFEVGALFVAAGRDSDLEAGNWCVEELA